MMLRRKQMAGFGAGTFLSSWGAGKPPLRCFLLVAVWYVLGVEAQLPAMPWEATDGLGRELPGSEECGAPRDGKFVGVFYFLWLGGHKQMGPHNITEILKQPERTRQWGEKNLFHFWDEPRFGYYLMDDEWVIAKHAQMLADAGVDVVVFDVTNAFTYKKQYLKLCEIFTNIRAKGGETPQVAFLFNSNHVKATKEVFADFYKPGLYPELWFRWKGKPLLMTNPEGQPQEILDFFSIRRSWAWSKLPPKNDWFGDGKDKWPWIDKTPQAYGWHEDPDTPEQVAVASASHPVNDTGRSHKNGKQPPPEEQDPMIGTYFQEQWDHALKVDPEFIFITGWNEWVAQRFIYDKKGRSFAGGKIKNGDTWFIDQYSIEYSRDCEPMKGGFEDNYYYQMVSNIRKFKGVKPQPVTSRHWKIVVDGSSNDWKEVQPEYSDDVGDTYPRNHDGYADAGPYVNDWGRNDIVSCKVARDATNVYFSVRTAEPLVVPSKVDPGCMNLLIRFPGRDLPDWEGYHFRIVPMAAGEGLAAVCAWRSDRWKKVMEIPFGAKGDFVELAFPLGESATNLQTLEIEFKWFDHMPEPFTALDFMDHGDTAPNNRFRYVHKWKIPNL